MEIITQTPLPDVFRFQNMADLIQYPLLMAAPLRSNQQVPRPVACETVNHGLLSETCNAARDQLHIMLLTEHLKRPGLVFFR